MGYYADLGVDRAATQDEIYAKYQALLHTLSADRTSDPDLIQNIEEAYQVLGDPAARQLYDDDLEDRVIRQSTKRYKRYPADVTKPSLAARYRRKYERQVEREKGMFLYFVVGAVLTAPLAALTSMPFVASGVGGLVLMVVGPIVARFVTIGK